MSANIRQFIFNMQAQLKFIHDSLLGNSLLICLKREKAASPDFPVFTYAGLRINFRRLLG